MAFGKSFKKLIEAVPGLSMQMVANAIGVDAARLRKWGEKDMTPRYNDAKKIEQFFGLTLDEIINLKDLNNFEFVPRETEVPVKRLDQREIQESLIAINAQLRVLFLKIVEIESRDPKTKLVKRSTTAVTLELEDLIRQETKRLLNELKLS